MLFDHRGTGVTETESQQLEASQDIPAHCSVTLVLVHEAVMAYFEYYPTWQFSIETGKGHREIFYIHNFRLQVS
jgi:hypothetical protein